MQLADYNPTMENVSFTIAVIKPDTCLRLKNVQDIINLIEEEGFIIKNMIQRDLTKEEALNLFYKHQNKDYTEKLMNYILSGECIILMLTHERLDPITTWKKMIGNMDPVEAKKSDPKSLRAIYGVDKIKNELHGSDNTFEANKERDIFNFPIPQKIPEFRHEKAKLTIDDVLKFVFPPSLEHPQVNARLDMFAIYGPTLNYHSIDVCFCRECKKTCALDEVNFVITQKLESEAKRLGINLAKPNFSNTKKSTLSSTSSKLQISPIRLLNEDSVQRIWNKICEKCKTHCESYRHLVCGQEQQHIMTDQEIKELAKEINKKELLELLIIEKGNAAKIMIETIPIEEPKEFEYNRHLIAKLFEDLPTDYYNRYSFNDLHQVILEDRRIRMNSWVSKIVGKPPERFKNPKLVDPTIPTNKRSDLNSVHFTLMRTMPLSLTIKKEDIKYTPINYPHSVVDKPKLQTNEERVVLTKKVHRYVHNLLSVDDLGYKDFKNSLNLLRNYNDGRHGGWDNYSCLNGNKKESYVKTVKNEKNKDVA